MSEENIPAAFLDKYPESAVQRNLNRIWQQIESQWGTQACAEYLESLLLVEDGRERDGFDSVALSELLLLALLHEEAHPEFSSHPRLGEGKQFMFGTTEEGSTDGGSADT